MKSAKNSVSELTSPPQQAETRNRANHSNHIVQFYEEDSSFIESLSQSVGAALQAGDGVIVIATEAHREGLAKRLKTLGVDTAEPMARGHTSCWMPPKLSRSFCGRAGRTRRCFAEIMGNTIARAREAAEGDDPGIFAFGEMVALLCAEGKSGAAIRLEHLWNDLAGTHAFSLCCAYPMRSFDREEHGELFLKICAEHSGVIPGESYTALEVKTSVFAQFLIYSRRRRRLKPKKPSAYRPKKLFARGRRSWPRFSKMLRKECSRRVPTK